VALAVPLALVTGVTVLEVAETARDAGEVRKQTDLAEAVIGPSGIVSALQDERTWAAVELTGQDAVVTVPVEGYDTTRSRTDAAIAAFAGETAGRDDRVAQAFDPATDGIGHTLEEVRAEIDAFAGTRDLTNIEFTDRIFERYSERIEPFFEATTRLTVDIEDTDLRRGAVLADVVARQIETFSLLATTTVTETVLSRDGPDRAGIAAIAVLLAEFRSQAAVLRGATGPYARLGDEQFPEALTESVDEHVQHALSTGQVDLPALLADMNVPADEGYAGYKETLHRLITARADHLRSAAEARQARFAVVACVVLVGTIALTVRASLSITRPLRSLTRQAQELAARRLPQAVQGILRTPLGGDLAVPPVASVVVDADDELANVASALNTLQDSALQLAVDHTVLRRNVVETFLNLGRRNQNLLVRQLDFVTELESGETDPDTLASLFRLDHLATRMRRNAESLLVLAGAGPARSWTARVGLQEVVRAALGEVEDYPRVVVRQVVPAEVAGSVSTDLAHLLAELMENALTFSSSDRHVEVRGRDEPDGGGYVVTITDSGVGMAPDELARANRRLAGDESFTVAPSQYLGHYVAGHLASRHGIALRLEPSPGGGITASIALPPRLLIRSAPALPDGVWPADVRHPQRVGGNDRC
jgi:signal transduction histidine kinase